MKEKKIKVLKVEPKKPPTEIELENDLDALQESVSIGSEYKGLIEIINLNADTCILCNEEGKLIGLEPNRRLGKDILCGVFYVTGQDGEGNLSSLNANAMGYFKNFFGKIENISPDEVTTTVQIYFEWWGEPNDI